MCLSGIVGIVPSRPVDSAPEPQEAWMKFDDDLEVTNVMVIYAHPDDAEFGCSGTIAKWAREGVEVTYCMVTNGASGTRDKQMTREKLAAIREKEQRDAAELLGVKNVIFLGFEDGYLYP